MLNSEHLITILGIIAIISATTVVIMLILKTNRIKELELELSELKKSLNEMDEQAKLIVRTDMQLNKTQEELDKKISGLYTLQKFSHTVSTTLEENQIFKKLEYEHLDDLGFTKTCTFLWNEEKREFRLCGHLGYSEEEISAIKSATDLEETYLNLIKKDQAFSSGPKQSDAILKDIICRVFNTSSFVIAPILPREGDKGFLFVGTEDINTLINEGEEELVTILANQLGQALENARLFEKTWRAQQDLERKVNERTQELKQALSEVKIISKRKTDFISSVSHELRTPLTSIKGYASILLAGKLGEIPAEIKERLGKINRHSDELVHMVNDLLDIARIESGRVAMKKESLDLNKIIESVSDLLIVLLKEKQIEFSLDIPDNSNAIFADRSQIERVFINIIGNAVKFTPAGGRITVRAHKKDKDIQVDISDTGCGMPQEALESIFEEFYRVDNPINDGVKGTGL
ncbi:MAG: histidine kinase dimerization/phospho-acceptor domain-containing protein, partial [Candidatus Omnitrophica bacterium]|nr:histidine kinase dimerization/phospho-acceptor domain-containing protein [Candidatus Omnitrophota bacterium]